MSEGGPDRRRPRLGFGALDYLIAAPVALAFALTSRWGPDDLSNTAWAAILCVVVLGLGLLLRRRAR